MGNAQAVTMTINDNEVEALELVDLMDDDDGDDDDG